MPVDMEEFIDFKMYIHVCEIISYTNNFTLASFAAKPYVL
jgi:hypothetical protein